MSNGAILFPGQGAQALGMGLDLVAQVPAAREVFDRAQAVLDDLDLAAVLGGDDRAALDSTDVCQPAILVTSLVAMAALGDRLDTQRIGGCAGLSLGEYSALVWSGALELEAAVRLVSARGQAMQRAADERDSGMLSLVGATPEAAIALAAAARGDGVLVVANLLAPGQVALAGTSDALGRAQGLLQEHGIRKAVPLPVAGAFHSPCMESAAAALSSALDATTFSAPRVPVVMNVTGEATTDPGLIADLLRRQITSPVRWQASMETLLARGCDAFLEPAPGRQLTNMLRRYEQATTVATCGDVEQLAAFTRWPEGDS